MTGQGGTRKNLLMELTYVCIYIIAYVCICIYIYICMYIVYMYVTYICI